MKILVTGGAGFIGSHIQDRLIKLNHKVAVLDNLRSGKKENINEQVLSSGNKKFKFYQVDLVDKNSTQKAILDFEPEVIFHLAAQNEVPYSMEYPFEDAKMNIFGMMNLLDAAVKAGTKKIVYSNTGGALYGEAEEKDLPLDEDFKILKPTSFYGASKGCAEWYLKLYGNLYNLTWISLRYSNVYGPRQDGNKEAGVVAIFTSKLLNKEQPTINGNGAHTRDYIYVGDVVDANIFALNHQGSDYYNISTGVQTSNIEVFQTIEKELKTGVEPLFGPPRPGDPLHNSLSPKKAKKMGWQPKVKFKDGVKLTIAYYLSKP